jgi:hypothetical protein
MIYKKQSKENQEKAPQIRAGGCTERRLWRNWRSPAVHLTYLVASLPVRELVRLLFWFYVREPICSRWESFDNRGSAVFVFRRRSVRFSAVTLGLSCLRF